MNRNYLELFATFLFLCSCGTSSAVRTGKSIYPPTKPASIIVFENVDAIDVEYEVVGLVSSQKTAGWTFTNVNESELIKKLKVKAASLGADAIILDSLENDSVPWGVKGAGGSSSLDRKTVRAKAIKFSGNK